TIGLVTSLLTAIYMFPLVFLAFHGPSHAAPGTAHPAPTTQHPAPGGVHDAPPAMAIALVVLAIGSIVAGYVSLGGRFEHFLEPSFEPQAPPPGGEGLEIPLMIVSSIVALVGIGLAFYFFFANRRAADGVAERFAGLHRLLLNKYYVDEIYDATVVAPVRIVSEEALSKRIDARGIDGAVNGVAEAVGGMSEVLRRAQNGSVRTYAASVFLGVVAILGYYLWK